ncbi:hypothetical protein LEP1GSC168_0055 [Leptospira santarosai str. HAI134]|uniref:hypothetical protein n=1 Tax=Leptospira santarosai TaxID=28183 RepID=UPI0002BFBA2D|nr:hypothetical protein [Leptospira santarosai]EMO20765.1 hypothetical protein LEP1GSC168_0055 [Leptospira santarosai str. HAI134]
MIVKLPIPFGEIDFVDVKAPSPDAITRARSEAIAKRIIPAAMVILKDVVYVDDKPIGDDVKKIPFRSAEYIITQAFNNASKIARHFDGSSYCTVCGKENFHTRQGENDDRISLDRFNVEGISDNNVNFKIVVMDEKKNPEMFVEPFGGESKDDFERRKKCLTFHRFGKDGEDILEITSMTFRPHTLEDMMKVVKTAKTPKALNDLLYFDLLIDCDFTWSGQDNEIEDVKDIKNKFAHRPDRLFQLSHINYYDQIYEHLYEYGLKPAGIICEHCRNEYGFELPFENFFVYALRPNPGSMLTGKKK